MTNAIRSETKTLLSDIVFMRAGGLAGFDDRLEIGKDGIVHYESAGDQSRTETLPNEEISKLARLLQNSGLFDQDHTFTSVGADLITYTIQYNGVTVRADEGQVPDRLRPVLDELLLILNEV